MFQLNLEMSEQEVQQLTGGVFTVVCVDAKTVVTKNRNGEYVEMKLLIEDGPNKGMHIFHRPLFKHSNRLAVGIGLKSLRQFLTAVGHADMTNVDHYAFISKRCIAKCAVENNPEWGDQLKIEEFMPIPSGTQTAQQPAQQPATAAQGAQMAQQVFGTTGTPQQSAPDNVPF